MMIWPQKWFEQFVLTVCPIVGRQPEELHVARVLRNEGDGCTTRGTAAAAAPPMHAQRFGEGEEGRVLNLTLRRLLRVPEKFSRLDGAWCRPHNVEQTVVCVARRLPILTSFLPARM